LALNVKVSGTMKVLVVDIGGSHVKLIVTDMAEPRRFDSSPDLTPEQLVQDVRAHTADWEFDVVTIGYPGAIDQYGPRFEPGNLGRGWVGFDFARALGRPVRIVNDAVMQAIGAYDGGRMLFLGLGTGLGSALVTDHVAVSMDLGNLPWPGGRTLGERLGRTGLETQGEDDWQRTVLFAVETLRHAFVADYVVLGGGNAALVTSLPPHTRRGGNHDAFDGGFRVWEELVEPHDRAPAPAWRIIR
jgi:polyphosphate glucokinase